MEISQSLCPIRIKALSTVTSVTMWHHKERHISKLYWKKQSCPYSDLIFTSYNFYLWFSIGFIALLSDASNG